MVEFFFNFDLFACLRLRPLREDDKIFTIALVLALKLSSLSTTPVKPACQRLFCHFNRVYWMDVCNSEPSQEILLGTTRGPPKDCGLVSRGMEEFRFWLVSYITETILENLCLVDSAVIKV